MNTTKPRPFTKTADANRATIARANKVAQSKGAQRAAEIERKGGDPSVTTGIMVRETQRRRAQQTHPGKRARGASWQ